MSEHTIPANAVIPCPALSFRPRFVSACGSCPHFGGVIDTQPHASPDAPVSARYRISCAHAIARRFELIEGAPDAGP